MSRPRKYSPKEIIGPTPAARAGKLVLFTLPFLVGIFCVFLTFVPIGSIVGVEAAPAFALMAVFFWAARQPETFPPYAVFAAGLLQDLLSAGPIGLWAFVYVVVYGVVQTQRMIFAAQPDFVLWAGFLIAAAFAGAMGWGIASLYFGQTLPVAPVLLQLTVTVALFPIFAKIFARIERMLAPSL